MTMVMVMVVVMMPITVGDDAIDGDVVGDAMMMIVVGAPLTGAHASVW